MKREYKKLYSVQQKELLSFFRAEGLQERGFWQAALLWSWWKEEEMGEGGWKLASMVERNIGEGSVELKPKAP